MRSSASLACVAPEMVGAVWPFARPLIKRAIDRTGLCEFAAIESDVLSGRHLLWLAHSGDAIEAAATTELIFAGGKKVCLIVACGGANRRRWLHLIEGIEAYAKAEGCAAARIIGRKGWQRVLTRYRAKYAVMDKDLT